MYTEPVREKTNTLGFRPGMTQTSLYSHRSKLEVGYFGCRKKMNYIIRVAKTKALISCAVTAELICALFSHMQVVGFLVRRLILHRGDFVM